MSDNTSDLPPHAGHEAHDVESGVFRWPTPPFACYPHPVPQSDHEPCEIVGLNGRIMKGRLIFFVPDEQVAQVQVPPSRTTMPLRFGQFRSLLLTRPFKASVVAEGVDPHAAVLDQRINVEYRIWLKDGSVMRGHTMGQVEQPFGLFLFPPLDAEGTVSRLFVPNEVIDRTELGPRIGEVLVNSMAATATQIDHAVDEQARMRNQKLGEILLTRQVVTAEQLLRAIDQQSSMPMVRIGEALSAMGMITEAELHAALVQQQRDRGVPLGELLIKMGMVSREDLQTALARKMGYPLVNLAQFQVEVDALLKVPFAVAQRLNVVPLLLRDNTLIVALEDPSKRLTLAELEFITQCKIVPVLAQHNQIESAIRDVYVNIGADVGHPHPRSGEASGYDMESINSIKLVADLEADRDALNREEDSPIEQSDNSLVRLINTMIVEAYTQGVSDIHVECYPGREKVKIRFRKDGALLPYIELPHNYRNALVARLKIMCDLDISERRKPQDGKINFARFVPQYKLELRVATIPTNNGLEDVVMRLLSSAKPIPLDKIGLSPDNLERLQEAMERPYGMILCVGPTGSGKTTTLHSALSYINVPERKIWTAEDPIEITQPGLRQVQVNSKIDWTFAKALRAFLRADPDVIMVGEMRDEETASMGIEASLTGHLVLSTLHTNNAPETVTRLLDMGMDPFNFADSLLVVLAQRLVRRICHECRVSEPATQAYLEELLADYVYGMPEGLVSFTPDAVLSRWRQLYGVQGQVMLHHSKGCERCAHTGFKGRAGIHELMAVSKDLRRLIQTGARAEELQQQAIREGMRTLRQDGIDKVVAGITTLDEVRATSNR
ncbi:MAG: GspE/PulE family protein [Aquabacterium sp.]